MFFRFVAGSTALVVGGAIVVPQFRHKLDRNIVRPLRDYNQHLNSWNDFKTEEEFVAFVKEFGCGVVKMFKYEEDQ